MSRGMRRTFVVGFDFHDHDSLHQTKEDHLSFKHDECERYMYTRYVHSKALTGVFYDSLEQITFLEAVGGGGC